MQTTPDTTEAEIESPRGGAPGQTSFGARGVGAGTLQPKYKKPSSTLDISSDLLSRYIDRLDLNISLPALREIADEKPPAYDPSFGPLMFAYFNSREVRKKVFDTFVYKNGGTMDRERWMPGNIPHFTEFARTLRTTERTLKSWAKKYPEFDHYYQMCREIYEEFLIVNGLSGDFSPAALTFVATNKTDMKDKKITEERTVDLNKILDMLEQGVNPNKLTDGNIIDI